MLKLFNKKAQSTAEYAVLVGLVVAAAIGMQTYVKRGLQERMHQAALAHEDKVQNDGGWEAVTGVPGGGGGAPTTQFESDFLVSRSTQNVRQDDANSTMQKEGNITRSFDRKTEGETGDKQVQKYGGYSEQP